MAINTPAKRLNMMSVASPIGFFPLFQVDGLIDADDRAHLLHYYGGLFDSGGTTIKTINGLALFSVKTVMGLAKASIKPIKGL